jgi:hypothetical protein
MERAIFEADPSDALELSPAPTSIDPAQTSDLPDARANRDHFDLRDFADDFEPHWSNEA